ncbi:MAG: ABC transporter ATP-binding protein [Myxococcota bacterium]
MKKSKIDPAELKRNIERATLRRIALSLAPYRRHSTWVFVTIVLAALLNLVPSIFLKDLVDRAIPTKDVHLVLWLAAGMIAGPLVAGLLGVLQRYLAALIGERVMLDLRVAVYSNLAAQPMEYFVAAKPGEAVSRVLNDVQGVGSVVSSTLVNVFQNAIILITTLALIVALDWRLALVAAGMLPLFISPTRRVGRRRKELKREAQARTAELTGILTETLSVSGALLVQLFGRETTEIQRFRRKSEELMDLTLAQSLVGRWFQMLLQLFEAAGPALVFAVGGLLVIENEIALGTVVAFVTLLRRLYPPASALAGVRVDLLTSYAYFDRIFQVLDLVPKIASKAGAIQLPSPRGDVRFVDVSLDHGPHRVLDGLQLEVPAGKTVAILGPSGSGKTSLVSMIPRLWDPSAGAVLLDGVDLRELDLAWLRSSIAIVTQETFLFHDTVLENLRMARPQATMAEIESAARAALIHEVITALPEGYQTVVGERGYRFSGGERQRLAIARAILRDPKLLILDEATSALDSESEALVQQALEPLIHGRTTFIVAHRLTTVRHADLIVMIDRGKIEEVGSPSELLGRDGPFARLHKDQLEEPTAAVLDLSAKLRRG